MEVPRKPNSAPGESKGSRGPTQCPWVPSPGGKSLPLSDPGPACFILYIVVLPDGSCWEVRAPLKAVSSSSSNPLYQRDEA